MIKVFVANKDDKQCISTTDFNLISAMFCKKNDIRKYCQVITKRYHIECYVEY